MVGRRLERALRLKAETKAKKPHIMKVLKKMKAALNELQIFDERDGKSLLKDAKRIFGDVDPETAIKSIIVWKSREGAITFTESLEKAK